MDLYKRSERKFRLEIEGLRAVAALLVAVYHIWLGNVSGGVDVFFVVSGFLITTSLLNRFEREGKIDFIGFILRLAKRLFPAAFTVLFVVAILSFFFTLQVNWTSTVKELIASIFYIENWMLAINSVDYLAQNNEASPFQHFWAMSTQGQFYFIWPTLLFLTILMAKIIKKRVRVVFLFSLTFAFVSSLAYSVYLTEVNQPWAYFDTFARVWEFSIGGIVALIIANIKLNRTVSFILGWLGLIGLVSCGLILHVSTMFPGYAALWPVLSAVFILIASNRGGNYAAHRLLSSKPLVKFGSVSYGFYLWHWPILIFYFNITGNATANLVDGLLIILISFILSYLTINIIEKPIRNKETFRTKKKIAIVVIGLMIPALSIAVLWATTIKYGQEIVTTVMGESIDTTKYPGASALMNGKDTITNEDTSLRPLLMIASSDLAKSYDDGCHQEMYESNVIECEYGETTNYDHTIALVGGSHSTHWLPALEEVAKDGNIRILNYTKSACRFTTEYDTNENEKSIESCEQWNEELIDILSNKKPDLVFTTANATEIDGVPNGYIERWNMLNELGIDVFAIRDNPRFEFDVPSCVQKNGINSSECTIDKNEIVPDNLMEGIDIPKNVYYSDMSDYFCEDDICKPVIGNVLVYRDSHHMTATFSKTLAPMLKDEINNALKHQELK